ncbi:SLAP domain-containing protein [Fictibacillus iocasae]|uniref:SLAP domain-containing protein n=1 Tax=Fictibacillus iocasae TaxID=2715437 RepID=A0ABW2NMI0_9BACL
MQKLLFEQAWDRALSGGDRDHIVSVFEETRNAAPESALSAVVLRKAVNHKGERLLTVLLHNRSQEEAVFNDRTVAMRTDNGQAEEALFTLPVAVLAHHSMPWTFIFPAAVSNETFLNENITLIF